MTERERVLTLLRGGQPDRVPWFGDLDYWATALIGRGQRPPDFKTSDAYLDWHRDLAVGYYLQGYFPFKPIIENCEVKEWHEGNGRYRPGTGWAAGCALVSCLLGSASAGALADRIGLRRSL